MTTDNINTAAKVATVAAKVAKVEQFVTQTRKTFDAWALKGVGIGNFGCWVGVNNVMLSLCEFIARNYGALFLAICEQRKGGEFISHSTSGVKGTHAGLCTRYNVSIVTTTGETWEGAVYMKSDGTLIVDGLLDGFTTRTVAELIEEVRKVGDVRRVRLDERKDAKTAFTGVQVDAALLGGFTDAKKRYQGLMLRDKSGVRVITRIFGEAMGHETQRAVSVTTLKDAEKERAQAWILDGIAEAKKAQRAKGRTAGATKLSAKDARLLAEMQAEMAS